MNKVEVLCLDKDGFTTDRRDFCTQKEALVWIRETALDPEFWDRRAESKGFAEANIETIQLLVDDEIRRDWFPDWPHLRAA